MQTKIQKAVILLAGVGNLDCQNRRVAFASTSDEVKNLHALHYFKEATWTNVPLTRN
jgi:hypothetical protein